MNQHHPSHPSSVIIGLEKIYENKRKHTKKREKRMECINILYHIMNDDVYCIFVDVYDMRSVYVYDICVVGVRVVCVCVCVCV